jgi:flavodoxin
MTDSGTADMKPRGVVCYYSGSGNTRLACRYIAANIKSIELELINMVSGRIPDLQGCAIVGFATFTDFLGAPQLVKAYLEKLPI